MTRERAEELLAEKGMWLEGPRPAEQLKAAWDRVNYVEPELAENADRYARWLVLGLSEEPNEWEWCRIVAHGDTWRMAVSKALGIPAF